MRPDSDSLLCYDLAVARLLMTSLVIVAAAVLLSGVARRPFDHTPADDFRVDSLSLRIDANSATWPELALLPGLGEQLACRVVAFREASGEKGPAFCEPDDLDQVFGIGPGIVARVTPYLRFPQECAGRKPATTPDAEKNR
jgi:DNA uptake protein ComE-like DNA-binding protein